MSDKHIVPVYLGLKELIIWCCTLQDVCASFDDDDPDKEPLLNIRDKLLSEADIPVERFWDLYDRFHIRPK